MGNSVCPRTFAARRSSLETLVKQSPSKHHRAYDSLGTLSRRRQSKCPSNTDTSRRLVNAESTSHSCPKYGSNTGICCKLVQSMAGFRFGITPNPSMLLLTDLTSSHSQEVGWSSLEASVGSVVCPSWLPSAKLDAKVETDDEWTSRGITSAANRGALLAALPCLPT